MKLFLPEHDPDDTEAQVKARKLAVRAAVRLWELGDRKLCLELCDGFQIKVVEMKDAGVAL